MPWLLGNLKSSLNQSTWVCNNACAADPLNSTGSKLLLPGCRTRAGAKSRLLPEVPSLTRSDGAWPGLGRIALASMQPSATQGLTASGPDAAWAGLCRVLLVAAAGLCLLAHPIFGECCNFAPGQHCPGQLLVSPVLGKGICPQKGSRDGVVVCVVVEGGVLQLDGTQDKPATAPSWPSILRSCVRGGCATYAKSHH